MNKWLLCIFPTFSLFVCLSICVCHCFLIFFLVCKFPRSYGQFVLVTLGLCFVFARPLLAVQIRFLGFIFLDGLAWLHTLCVDQGCGCGCFR